MADIVSSRHVPLVAAAVFSLLLFGCGHAFSSLLVTGVLYVHLTTLPNTSSEHLKHHIVTSIGVAVAIMTCTDHLLQAVAQLVVLNNIGMILFVLQIPWCQQVGRVFLALHRVVFHPWQWWAYWHEWSYTQHLFHCLALGYMLVVIYTELFGTKTVENHMTENKKKEGSARIGEASIRWLFFAVSKLSGKPYRISSFKEMTDDTALKILASSNDKGFYLEKLHSLHAWHPIVPIESVDGKRWKWMSSVFRRILIRLQKDFNSKIIQECFQEFIEDFLKDNNGKLFGGRELYSLLVTIACRVLFEEHPDKAEITFWVSVTTNVAGSVSAKAPGDSNLKKLALEKCKEFQSKQWWKDVFSDGLEETNNLTESEMYSCVLQPFLISLTINTTDALMAVWKHSPDNKSENIIKCIASEPAFPIFERWKDGIQHLILVDSFTKIAKEQNIPLNEYPSWMAFGAGKRQCPGKSLALTLVSTVYRELLQLADSDLNIKVDLQEGHKYTGRGNDEIKETTSLYQVEFVCRVLYRALRVRLAGE
eukprot:m.2945 g.2945  ORF g.2945 m.2945 type:complete len:535 (-) comp2628_c0_seq1:267-1871(-)